jgi:hypothetical protein
VAHHPLSLRLRGLALLATDAGGRSVCIGASKWRRVTASSASMRTRKTSSAAPAASSQAEASPSARAGLRAAETVRRAGESRLVVAFEMACLSWGIMGRLALGRFVTPAEGITTLAADGQTIPAPCVSDVTAEHLRILQRTRRRANPWPHDGQVHVPSMRPAALPSARLRAATSSGSRESMNAARRHRSPRSRVGGLPSGVECAATVARTRPDQGRGATGASVSASSPAAPPAAAAAAP